MKIQATEDRPQGRERTPDVLVHPVATAHGEIVANPLEGQRRDPESEATDQTERP
jgi:hypothetical protein